MGEDQIGAGGQVPGREGGRRRRSRMRSGTIPVPAGRSGRVVPWGAGARRARQRKPGAGI
ncbi:hypothetical protein GCM10010368_40120 [Streptomyces roseiscleroticus]|uniref:Uncharacterized protein n=1 Tax=Streptomyces roseiscleroticus TaxID=1972 RepID=A0ABN3ES11_9ACTN